MKSWETSNKIRIHGLLTGRSNNYLVEFGDQRILVDTARKNRYRILCRRLKEKLGDYQLNYLFLTHTHYDHVENAARIKKDFGCKVIVDEKESTCLQQGSSPLPHGTNVPAKAITWLGKKLTNLDRYERLDCDVCVDDIYEIKTRNDSIRMLRTPGHSPGSLSLILDGEIALVGDAIFGVFRNSAFPPFADNIAQLLESWRKLLNTDCTVFLPGHGRMITREVLEKNLNFYSGKFALKVS